MDSSSITGSTPETELMRDQLFKAWQFCLANRLTLPSLTIMLHMLDGPLHCACLSTDLGVPAQNIHTTLNNLRYRKLISRDNSKPIGWHLTQSGALLINSLKSTLATNDQT